MTPCKLLNNYRRFGGDCCLYREEYLLFVVSAEDGGSTLPEVSVYFNRQGVMSHKTWTFINSAEKSSDFNVSLLVFTLQVAHSLTPSPSASHTHAHPQTHSIYSVFLCYFTPAVHCEDYMPNGHDGEVAARTRRTAGYRWWIILPLHEHGCYLHARISVNLYLK
jgi:hypothetical protein